MRAIYELTAALSSTLSYKRVLESALNLSASALNPDPEQLHSDPLVGVVMLFNGGKLRIGSARRFTTADMRVTFDAAEGILKKTIDEGEPLWFKDIGYDPELGRVIALRNCTSGYCFPLRSGFNVYGVLLFAHPDSEYFTMERRNLLDIIGRQAVIAIQNARLYQDLVEAADKVALWAMVSGFALRVVAPQIDAGHYLLWLQLAALMWFVCFSILGWRYIPMLLRPRVDGKEH